MKPGEYSCLTNIAARDLSFGLSNERVEALLVKEKRLVRILSQLEDVMVAYSGGVDSSLLAHYARAVLGDRATIVIAVSPSLANEELLAARAQAAQFGWALEEISTDEVDKPEYQANDGQRCYFCKSTLFEAMTRIALERGARHLAYGANMSDLGDIRPGMRAAAEHQVLSPLQEAGLEKADIRELARAAALPSWNRPQSACLSSRFPTFEKVTPGRLLMVERAEEILHALGFSQVRVRYHSLRSAPGAVSSGAAPGSGAAPAEASGPAPGAGAAPAEASAEASAPAPGAAPGAAPVSSEHEGDAKELSLARIEVESSEMERFASDRELMFKIGERLKAVGFTFVTLDMQGYRQGSGNVVQIELTSRGSR